LFDFQLLSAELHGAGLLVILFHQFVTNNPEDKRLPEMMTVHEVAEYFKNQGAQDLRFGCAKADTVHAGHGKMAVPQTFDRFVAEAEQ
jgi:hypothetical protein